MAACAKQSASDMGRTIIQIFNLTLLCENGHRGLQPGALRAPLALNGPPNWQILESPLHVTGPRPPALGQVICVFITL